MSTTIDELITIIDLRTTKESERAFKQVKNNIFSIRKVALLAGSALAGFGASLSIVNVAKSIDQQAKFAAGIGISFENLQKLQFAAQKAGATTGELNSFLSGLTRTMSSTIPGRYNATLLQMGVKAKTVQEAVVGLAGALGDIDKAAERQQFGSRLGASTSIVNFLSQGQEKIARDIKEGLRIGAIIPGGLAEKAAELNSDALLKLKSTIKGLSSVINVSLAPALSGVLNQFDEWIVVNKEIIGSGIGVSLRAIGNSISFIGTATKGVLVVLRPFIKGLSFAEKSAEKLATILSKNKFAINAKKINPFTNISLDENVIKSFNTMVKEKTIPISAAANSAASVSNRTNNNSNRSITNTFNIKIDGAQLPQETAQEVVKQFELATAAQVNNPGYNRGLVG